MLGITRMSHPGVFGWLPGRLREVISGGVRCSLPSQNGHASVSAGVSFSIAVAANWSGLFALSVEIITHLPITGSRLNSGMLTSVF